MDGPGPAELLYIRDRVALPPVPLRTGGKQFANDDVFLKASQAHCAELRAHAPLRQARILDFGCGVGRLYYGFSTADEPASYVGADIRRDAIAWVSENIAKGNARFRYVWSDVHNGRYNPKGGSGVPHWRSQLGGPFDIVYANSVLSHMLMADSEATLALFAQTMAPDAIAYVTAFVDREIRGVVENPEGWGTLARTPLHYVVYEAALLEGLIERSFRILKRERPGRFRQTVYILQPR